MKSFLWTHLDAKMSTLGLFIMQQHLAVKYIYRNIYVYVQYIYMYNMVQTTTLKAYLKDDLLIYFLSWGPQWANSISTVFV